jgi:dCMP deaminase
MSRAKRLQVGAVIVKENNIISFSWNGTPAGWDNNCENKVFNTRFTQQLDGSWIDPRTYQVVDNDYINEQYPYEERSDVDNAIIGRYGLKTKPEVLHAERNALDKLAKGLSSGSGATMFITHAPCLECAKSIYGAGITKIYYSNNYRSHEGIEFLKKCGIATSKIS